MFTVTNIGVGSSEITADWKGSSHLVAGGNDAVLLDCGEGVSEGLFVNDLLLSFNTILISHFHADHVAGLFTLAQALYLQAKSGEPRQVSVYMPEAGLDTFPQVFDLFALPLEKQVEAGLRLELLPVEAGKIITVGEFKITPFHTDHFSAKSSDLAEKYQSFGYQLNHPEGCLVYSGDIGTIDCLTDHLTNGCALLAEGMHADWRDIISESTNRGVRRVIFTHLPSWVMPELSAYSSENDLVIVAENNGKIILTQDGKL